MAPRRTSNDAMTQILMERKEVLQTELSALQRQAAEKEARLTEVESMLAALTGKAGRPRTAAKKAPAVTKRKRAPKGSLSQAIMGYLAATKNKSSKASEVAKALRNRASTTNMKSFYSMVSSVLIRLSGQGKVVRRQDKQGVWKYRLAKKA